MSKETSSRNTNFGSNLDLKEEIGKYIKYWPWLLISIAICVIAAYIYLRYSTPVYKSISTIIIKDSKSNNSSEMGGFSELALFSATADNSIENEIGIMKSRRIIEDVVSNLDLNIKYIVEGSVRDVDVYDQSPFFISILKNNNTLPPNFLEFKVTALHKDGLEIDANNKTINGQLNTPIELDWGQIIIRANSDHKLTPGAQVKVRLEDKDNTVNSFRSRLNLNLTDKNSSLLELSIVDPLKERGRDFLDQLVIEYNKDAIEDKNLVARNTASFIQERLEIINRELDSVESGKEEFKEDNRLTDIEAEATLYIQNASEFNKKEQELGTQIELANAMLDYILEGDESDLLPANLGIEESGLNQKIEEFNQMILERNRILAGSTEKNPLIVKLSSQIDQLKSNIKSSLKYYLSNLNIAKRELENQMNIVGKKISSVPSKERQFRGIERQQNIKEALYLFLLQKREENSLSLAVTAPKAKIVDRAYSLGYPVSPNNRSIYLGSLLMGLFIPFTVIYLKNLLNNKIKSRKDIEVITKEISIVGEIPKILKNQKDFIEINDRSMLAESFRILITNIQYLLFKISESKTGKILFVTSTIKGEGKTFNSINLAITLANTQKKVVVMGADLRNPQLQRYEKGVNSKLGVSDYLFKNDLQLGDLIHPSNLNSNLDILASGTIPPNPSELLRNDKIGHLFDELKNKYDYVIVDTAPSMLVADTFLINQYSDLTLYVLRAGKSERKFIDFALDSKVEGKLKNVGFIVNDVDISNLGYGSKYGYGYGEEESSKWEKLKSKVF